MVLEWLIELVSTWFAQFDCRTAAVARGPHVSPCNDATSPLPAVSLHCSVAAAACRCFPLLENLLHRQNARPATHIILSGPAITDARLTALLAHHYQNDALLQLLLHAVRVLMQHGPAAPAPTEDQSESGRDAAAGDAAEKAAEKDREKEVVAEAEEAVRKSVGLPELLDAMQEFSKVGPGSAVCWCTAV